MTVMIETNYNIWQGNGAAVVFPFQFPVLAAEDLDVSLRSLTTGLSTIVSPSSYVITGLGDVNGGSIEFILSAPSSDVQIILQRIVPYTQPLDLINQSGFYPETVEEQLDRTTMQIQQLLDISHRAITVPIGEDGLELPREADRASKYPVFSADGSQILMSSGTGADSGLRADLGNFGGDLVFLDNGLSLNETYARLPSDDSTKYWIGIEYLSTFRETLTDGNGSNVTMSGDSTTEGTGLSGGYIPDVHLRSLARDYGADYLVINNRGQSGKDTADWLADYLADDIALSTNLYILRWGVNDPDTALKNLSVAESLANYELALQTIRAAKDISDCSILIMAPNACIGRGRTEPWFREMVQGLRKLARQYLCAFFDTFNYTRDALQNIGIGWDDVLADGTMAIHPLAPVSGMIYNEVANILFAGLGPNKSNHFHNRRGATGQELSAATLPAAFEYGITMDRAYFAEGFPADGYVVTYKNNFNDENAKQEFWDNNGVQIRVGGSSWLDWLPLGSIVGIPVLGANWGTFGAVVNYTARKSGNTISLTGILDPGVGAGTNPLTLPVGFRPVGRTCHLMAITDGGPMHLYIEDTGLMTIDSVPASYLSLEGITFQINQ